MKTIFGAVVLIVCLSSAFLSPRAQDSRAAAAAADQAPTPGTPLPTTHLADGRLTFPVSYREWIYLSSGLDMSYRKGPVTGHSMFDNVFAEPGAYRAFVQTGAWPDGTVLVLEVRGAAEKGSINQSGKFQTGEAMAVEVHIKETKRFAGGWGFFAFSGTEPATQIPVAADCYSCHRDHAFVDATFVQFYPTLLRIARQQGTVKAGQ
jgi:hypothetical protein